MCNLGVYYYLSDFLLSLHGWVEGLDRLGGWVGVDIGLHFFCLDICNIWKLEENIQLVFLFRANSDASFKVDVYILSI